MNQKLQQAILAARAGQKKEAQLLLTQVLKDDPNEVQAWFLLSHIVDSEQKQINYLKKVVALDPAHQKARQRLAQLEPPQSLPSIEEFVGTDSDQSWAEVLPERISETIEEELSLETVMASPDIASIVEEPISQSAPASLELEPELAAISPPVAVEMPSQTTTSPVASALAATEVDNQRQLLLLTLGLIGLVAAATIVFIALLYAIFNAF